MKQQEIAVVDTPEIETVTQLEETFENYQKWKKELSIYPADKYLTPHPSIRINGQPLLQLPIDKVRARLEYFFMGLYKIQVIEYKLIANSITVSVRVHYYQPFMRTWLYHDGVGAIGLQTDKDASATDFSRIKHDAVHKGIGAAKSFAIKNACKEIGAAFGGSNEYEFMAHDLTAQAFKTTEQLLS